MMEITARSVKCVASLFATRNQAIENAHFSINVEKETEIFISGLVLGIICLLH